MWVEGLAVAFLGIRHCPQAHHAWGSPGPALLTERQRWCPAWALREQEGVRASSPPRHPSCVGADQDANLPGLEGPAGPLTPRRGP